MHRRRPSAVSRNPQPLFALPGAAFDDMIEAKGNAIGVIDMVLVALEWGLQSDGIADPMRCKMMGSMLKMTLTVHNKCEAEVTGCLQEEAILGQLGAFFKLVLEQQAASDEVKDLQLQCVQVRE